MNVQEGFGLCIPLIANHHFKVSPLILHPAHRVDPRIKMRHLPMPEYAAGVQFLVPKDVVKQHEVFFKNPLAVVGERFTGGKYPLTAFDLVLLQLEPMPVKSAQW